jgi:N-acetyl-anhydromuramoyl-L-alanine amidase
VFTQGWHTRARRVPSPNRDARPPGIAPELVVIHAISLPPGCYGGGYVERLFTNTLDAQAHPYFASIAELRVSAHFLVARDGALTQFVPIDERAWHAGVSCWRGRTACNDFSIGIELEGCDEDSFTAAQYTRLLALLDELAPHLPALTPAQVVGHSEIAPGRKTDPGPGFDWARVRAHL